MTLRTRALGRCTALLMAVFSLNPLPAQADPASDSVAQAADWLTTTWAEQPIAYFAGGTLADGIIALSAADQDPQTVTEMLWKLHETAPAYVGTPEDSPNPGGLAKVIIALDMANQDPRQFLGADRDLVAELKGYALSDSAAVKSYFTPYLIAIALIRAGEEVPDAIVETMTTNQVDGGFGYWFGDKFTQDPDYTGIAISAMNLVATQHADAQIRATARTSVDDAVAWAGNPDNQKIDEAGNHYWATYSSANSTGMLASALAEVGEDVASPVAYLVSQQAKTGDGSWAAAHNGTRGNVMATTQAILAPAGAGYGTAKSTQVQPINFNGDPEPEPTAKPEVKRTAPYTLAGKHRLNGRDWQTSCEPYSQTERCLTEIWATVVVMENGQFARKNGWAFNNLTYLPLMERAAWKGNPIGDYGATAQGLFTSAGRQWRTECDTTATGRGACRSYTMTTVYAATAKAGGGYAFSQSNQWVFNNMVLFPN